MKLGVDPGMTGALALLSIDGHRVVEVVDMPIMPLTGKRNQVNSAELGKLVRRWWEHHPTLTAYVEQVSAMPNQGVSSMFSFGMGYGAIQGVLAALGVPFVLVRPNAWKKRAGLLRAEKDQARTLAQQLYPQAPLARKKDIGRADAILIARFGGE